MYQNWYEQFGQPMMPTVSRPPCYLQRCPRCDGQCQFVVEDDAIDCPFCWGCGVIKIGLLGTYEPAPAPAEPEWHRYQREQESQSPAAPGRREEARDA
jgi:hypothetical protein